MDPQSLVFRLRVHPVQVRLTLQDPLTGAFRSTCRALILYGSRARRIQALACSSGCERSAFNVQRRLLEEQVVVATYLMRTRLLEALRVRGY